MASFLVFRGEWGVLCSVCVFCFLFLSRVSLLLSFYIKGRAAEKSCEKSEITAAAVSYSYALTAAEERPRHRNCFPLG